MQISGLKGASKHESAADENTHFTPATDKGEFSDVGYEGVCTEAATCNTSRQQESMHNQLASSDNACKDVASSSAALSLQ